MNNKFTRKYHVVTQHSLELTPVKYSMDQNEAEVFDELRKMGINDSNGVTLSKFISSMDEKDMSEDLVHDVNQVVAESNSRIITERRYLE